MNTPTEGGDSEKDKANENNGHVILVTRNDDIISNKQILCYDPQNGKHYVGEKAKAYLASWFMYEHTVVISPKILRVDDKALNPKYVNTVVKKRKQ